MVYHGVKFRYISTLNENSDSTSQMTNFMKYIFLPFQNCDQHPKQSIGAEFRASIMELHSTT